MTDNLYLFVTLVAASGWILLVVAPRKLWATFWYAGVFAPALLFLIAVVVTAASWLGAPPGNARALLSLDNLLGTLGNRGILLGFWTNVLGIELAFGAWMARKAAQIRMPLIRLIPCLVAAAFFPGFGFLLFWGMTAVANGWPEVARFEEQPPVNMTPVAARPTPGRPARSGALFG